MPNTREKLIEILRGAINTHTEKKEQWILGGKVGEEPMLFGSFADHLISHGVTFNRDCHWATEQAYKNGKADALKWISVKERLPEEDGKYLVFEQSGGRTVTSILRFAKDARKVDRYDFKGRWKNAWYEYDSEWGHYTVDSVTHWMPLPEPPKGE